jgi:HAD superfamily hydrolase (TIGR01484 family)
MQSPSLSPLNKLDASGIVGVFTDVDDTLTWDGQLDGATYQALESLSAAGFKIIPVTGRSSGWGHMMMSSWPIDAVVAESGGSFLFRNEKGHVTLQTHSDSSFLTLERERLLLACRQILVEYPEFQFATDNAFRIVDIAIDYNESVPRVSGEIVEKIIARLRADGFSARSSSIHINAWAGEFDKAPTALHLLRALFPEMSDPDQWIFIGDAPNDSSMFSTFTHSVAVANIKPYLSTHTASFTRLPSYLCQASYGEGFQELANHLLLSRFKP